MMPGTASPGGGGPNLPTDPEQDGSETDSETTSSNTTIPEHEFQNFFTPRYGRMFHKFGGSPYFLPADAEEWTRLREQHEILQGLVGDGFYGVLAARLNAAEVKTVLDLGCGPGIWVEEFNERFPSAYFVGVDLVPLRQQLEEAHFECYDLSCSGVGRPTGRRSVDAIHMRCLSFGFGDFRGLLQSCHRILSDGGLVLSIEVDWRLEHQRNFPHFHLQATRDFLSWVAECAAMADKEPEWDPSLIPKWLVDSGFGEIQEDTRLMPVGQWAGSQPMRELGALVQAMCVKFTEAMKPAFLHLLEKPPAQVDDLIAEVRSELESGETTGWSIPVYLVSASKASAARQPA